MNDSTSNQLNESILDYSSKTNQEDKTRCVVDERFVAKVGMIFKTLQEGRKFYKNYFKLSSFSTKIRNTIQKGDEIKNQLIVCSREGRWKSKISLTLKTNPPAGINCLARIYVHILKDVVHSAELYKDRHIWIPVYLDHHFWARMRSTQRSKIMHAFFNKFSTHNISLSQFVKQYDNCLASREQRKRIRRCRFSHRDTVRNKIINRGTVLAHVYRQEVQGQFRGKVNCITRSKNSTLGFTTYEVIEQVSNSTFNKFFVTYDTASREVKCQCLLFESRGILCRHSLSVLSFEQRRHTHIRSSQDKPLLEPRSKRFDDLVFRSHNICEFASESEELTKILHRAFDNVMAEMQEYQKRSKEKSLLSHEEATLSDVNDLQSPPRLNLLDGRSMIQSSSSFYNAPDMNYPGEDYRSFINLLCYVREFRVKHIEFLSLDIGNPEPPVLSTANQHK
ncbi:hypothetical protein Ahy_A05g022273 [Arachis hypogaea]|uniref:Protein FAR1-RELATED SEQUENCE n=1 Tax=Arachis hypogaea TaxID=3818 RepID=A0A445D024_ARAHY|nr:hypothetical protein Ahy_A05g022273 [Arachis hypogaea]